MVRDNLDLSMTIVGEVVGGLKQLRSQYDWCLTGDGWLETIKISV